MPQKKDTFPKKIAVLDIETASIRKAIERCEFAVAGIEVYVRHGRGYRSNGYTPYFQSDLPVLETFLQSFPGIIIGHNIFDFDYRVLRGLISLNGVIEKTVDTLWFLRQKDKEGWASLSLDSLAKFNFGKGKVTQSRKIPLLWKEGKLKRVLNYNRTDCRLTYELWRKMMYKRSVLTNSTQISILAKDIDFLIAKKPTITLPAWLQAIEDGGKLFKRPRPKVSYVNDFELKPDRSVVFLKIECEHCRHHFILITDFQKKFGDIEERMCPICEKQTPLGKIAVLVTNNLKPPKRQKISSPAFAINPYTGYPVTNKKRKPSMKVWQGPQGDFYFLGIPCQLGGNWREDFHDLPFDNNMQEAARNWLSKISWRGRWG